MDLTSSNESLLRKERKPKGRKICGHSFKNVAFVVVGTITFVYCCAELWLSLAVGSLALLADSFHNFSDVASIIIAFWASRAAKRAKTSTLSYGWARTEIVVALANAMLLLSLCLFIAAEAIPRLIEPTSADLLDEVEISFLIITGIGFAVNTFGTLAFAAAGASHGHSHGGGGHGHSHGGGHGHAHGKDKKKDKKEHGHGHGDKKKKDKHGHGDGHNEATDHNLMAVLLHYLGDAVSSLLVLILGLLIYFLPDCTGTGSNSNSSDSASGLAFVEAPISLSEEMASCKGLPFDPFGCISSFLIVYGDPIASLLIIVLILVTTIPLIKGAAHILMQSLPSHVSLDKIRAELESIPGVAGAHDLHAWQLVDALMIGTVHIGIEEGANITQIYKSCKEVFHKHGVHSTTIQPEIVAGEMIAQTMEHCEENCVEGCPEAWCCKTDAELAKERRDEYSIYAPL
jgi:zinc transporter 1